ncbi:uncharacterized protein LOC118348013 [Juglans regia]|uniref:Uncharacterized protein LOC118348013 n=1 Tax=Juglans regia TaxID=51240 RepID=A0A6P9EBC1_JUGRE|nr:uncharacterized protein LOC118348013 [Juglans regia]
MVSEEPISNESPIRVTTMSSSSDQNPNFNLNTQPPSAAEKPLIALDITAQINEKLTPSTFPQWRAQFEALQASFASTSSSITPLIATAKTSHEAWKKLNNLYASRSRTRAMQLKEELTLIQRGNRSITEYLHAVKALADEIAIIDHPISDDDLTLYVLNGLGPDFREIAAPI